MLIEMVDKFYIDYSEVQKETIKENTRYTWKQLYNNGKHVPKGNDDLESPSNFTEAIYRL